MSEYKFRAKPIQTGGIKKELAWVYGDLVQKDGKVYITPSHNKVRVENNLARLMVLVEVDPKTVGQYIRGKDKNRKEIYEGDITRDKKGLVEYVLFGDWAYRVKGTEGVYYKHNLYECEVIGNRWDNPELIGGTVNGY